jgi:hypothetical protein
VLVTTSGQNKVVKFIIIRRHALKSSPNSAIPREMSDETLPIRSVFSAAAATNRTIPWELMSQADLDGVLVIGASLDARSFRRSGKGCAGKE